MDVIDQSVELTRRQKGRFTKIIVLCAALFGLALVDMLYPEWKNNISAYAETTINKLSK